VAKEIKGIHDLGVQVAVVIGAGNIWRGTSGSKNGIDRATSDYMGMLATVINALAVQDALEKAGVDTRVQTALDMHQVAEPFIRRRAMRHMAKGRVVILAAGTGSPYFTTDSTSVQRALEIGADLLIMAKNGVNGVYTGDPKKDKKATFVRSITAGEVLEQDLKIADQSAIALAKEHGLPIKVVGVSDIAHAIDEKVGSTILP